MLLRVFSYAECLAVFKSQNGVNEAYLEQIDMQ